MASQPRKLKPSEINAITQVLANADPHACRTEDFENLLPLFPRRSDAIDWLATVQLAHAGLFKEAGYRADAVVWLAEQLALNLQGNKTLARVAYHLAANKRPGPNIPPIGRDAIFLSYAKPNRTDVNQLYDALAPLRPPNSVFQDHRCITLGQNWFQTIRNAAGSTSVLVCWVTKDFIRHPFCTYEVGIAEQAGATIVPIWIQGDPKLAPIFLYGRQGISPADPSNVDVNEIAVDLTKLL